jgi:ABC-type Mn2+/Zn2+ transport system permease subunit
VVTGVVFTTFFAFGVFLISLNPEGVQLQTIVLGNILGLSPSDLLQMLIICGMCLLILLIKWRDLFLVSFDVIFAKGLGLNVNYLQFLLLTLLSAAAVACLQAVGACLVVAMLITPGATAFLLTKKFSNMLFLAATFSALSSFIGIYLSYFLDGATAACIVVIQTIIFLIIYFQKIWIPNKRGAS